MTRPDPATLQKLLVTAVRSFRPSPLIAAAGTCAASITASCRRAVRPLP
ncbi:MAG: hypothetical protein GX044_09990 [Firmicutes bacterium]|nr:hypothetical protein [Bacillota bacterium]